MADTFTIGGSPIDPTTDDFIPVRFSERFGSIPSLILQRRGIALPGLPDPWIGKQVTWTDSTSTLRFTGDVVSMSPSYVDSVGWVLTYQCLGWRNRLDWFPHTDSSTGTFISAFNLTLTDPLYNPARAGRNVGQILTSVLTMLANAQTISGYGIGNYTGLPSSPTLPTVTTTDLAAMTVIPPRPVYFTGEKMGGAIEAFLAQWAPNYRMWIDPSGNFRFLDIRTFSAHTFTMGTDPVEPTELSRDTSDCFERVVARGQPVAVMQLFKTSNNTLVENFTWNGYATNAAAIAAWNPSQFQQPGTSQDEGTCTCPTTTTITLTSSDNTVAWSSGFWDQSHNEGTIYLSSTTISDYTQFWSARIINCPAMTAGGTCTVTIDNPIPSLNYDHYTIKGLSTDGSVVWTRYQIANSNIWPRVVNQATYPAAFSSPGQGGVLLTSAPMGLVLWSSSGSAPYNSFPLPFTTNSVTSDGNIHFLSPTYFTANNQTPADVWVVLPVNVNPNEAVEPPDSGGSPTYAGTSHSVDGLTRTLTVDIPEWTDPSLLSQIQAYCSDVLDSVKNTYVEGAVVYYGYYANALTFGLAINVAGNDGNGAYTTGWESIDIPIIQVDIEWPQGEGMLYKTTMHGSNRFRHYSAEAFMHPQRQWLSLGTSEGVWNPFGIAQPDTSSLMGYHASQGNYQEMAELLKANGMGATGSAMNYQGVANVMPDFGVHQPTFSLADTAAAGMPMGGGVHDPDSDPKRKGKVRNLPDQVARLTAAYNERQAIDARNAAKAENRQKVKEELARRAAEKDVQEGYERQAINERNADAQERRQRAHHDLADRALDKQIAAGREREAINQRNAEKMAAADQRERERAERQEANQQAHEKNLADQKNFKQYIQPREPENDTETAG